MRVLITGAGGHIGTAVVAELLAAGHDVTGLVRSDASTAAVEAQGGRVVRGDVDDLDLVRRVAADTDAVIHLAYDNNAAATGQLQKAADADIAVVSAFGDALAGTGRTFIGIGMGPSGDSAVDAARLAANPRMAASHAALALGDRGIRAMLVGIPPVTHSDRDHHGFLPLLIGIARRTGVSGYLEGAGVRWAASHTLDLAHLYRLVLENGESGTAYLGAAEPALPVADIAAAIGDGLGLPVRGIPADEAAAHFAPFPFMGLDIVMPNDATRAALGWEPNHPGVLADLAEGHYFTASGIDVADRA